MFRGSIVPNNERGNFFRLIFFDLNNQGCHGVIVNTNTTILPPQNKFYNITMKISIPDICKYFQVSTGNFYAIFNEKCKKILFLLEIHFLF